MDEKRRGGPAVISSAFLFYDLSDDAALLFIGRLDVYLTSLSVS